MSISYWNIGFGKINLVLLHGWGCNSKIWFFIIKKLIPYFRLYLIDLPGFGYNSQYFGNISLEKITEIISKIPIPNDSIWLGWSLGGLVASKIAILNPKKIKAVINVSSSPCFVSKKKWPGINLIIFNKFKKKLELNYLNTIKNFFLLYLFNKRNIRKNNIFLEKFIFSQPLPNLVNLKNGINILQETDLRKEMKKIKIPVLYIYGKYDYIIPYNISNLLKKSNNKYIKSHFIIDNSYHAPFISQTKIFCKKIIKFTKNII